MNRESVQTDNAPKAIGPYEQAIKASGFIYTAAQIPIDPKTGNFVEGGITAQTRQVLENLKAVLEAGGSSLDRVVKATRVSEKYGGLCRHERCLCSISRRRQAGTLHGCRCGTASGRSDRDRFGGSRAMIKPALIRRESKSTA